MKTYFISGGTGSFGKELVKVLLKKKLAKKIIIFSRDEFKQSQMQKISLFNKNKKIMRYFIGDVRDKERVFQIMEGNQIDVVIHAAALKHVPVTEYNPFETIKTNVIGAQNVIESSMQYNVKKVIALSTDKACSPINLYGATKLCSDKLFVAANLFKGKKKIDFSVVRYGNVLGSRGSVVPIFLRQKENNKNFTITDKRMTRFNITLSEAVTFVLNCIKKMKGGEIFVPKIPSYRILDLVKAISDKKKIEYIGIRPGEKLHEEMISSTDAINTTEHNNYYIIHPSYEKNRAKKSIRNFSSENNKKFLTTKELIATIKKNIHSFEIDK
jgi:UDP-N-acetylglucosamine 4,6-dehydratase/5-epimerase